MPLLPVAFRRRLAALLIDAAVLALPVLVLLALSGAATGSVRAGALASLVLVALYFGVMESSAREGSLGKRLANLKVEATGGGRLDPLRAGLRALPLLAVPAVALAAAAGVAPHFVLEFAAVTALICAFALLQDGTGRCWHDRLTRSRVVHAGRFDSPGEDGAAGHFDTRVLR